KALKSRDFSSAYLGSLHIGTQPVGLAVSPDGLTLYATTFIQDASVPGRLTTINVGKATQKGEMGDAVISQVAAGCHPARIVVDGKTVWVTTRQSNFVLGYSAARLKNGGKNALIAKVHVGQQPIGAVLLDGGKKLIVSDNDNTPPPQTAHNLAVIDTEAALLGEPALLGYIPSGPTPRDMAALPNGQFLYVTNRKSGQIQIVDLSKNP